MKRVTLLFQAAMIGLLVFGLSSPAMAGTKTGYQTGFTAWRAAENGFAGWTLTDAALQNGALVLAPSSSATPKTDAAGAYYLKNYYNGGTYYVGEAISPELSVPFAFKQAIASWNAATPAGTWVETWVRARLGDRWSKWYSLGVWAEDNGAIERHSVKLQGDADGYVSVDTLVLSKGKVPANALQVKVQLFSANPSAAVPVLRNLSLAYSGDPVKSVEVLPGNPANWNTQLNLPQCSQMLYPDGGNVWCSPTSVSMVLGYWGYMPGPCEPRVRDVVVGVYDWIYDGHGNWPFNTAYAAAQTPNGAEMEGYVRRYGSLNDLEPWIKAGVPVVMSIAWGKSDLDGAAIPSSSGHLIVLVGFDASGNPIVNDPAFDADNLVLHTYDRTQLETVWQTNSGGTVYVIYPAGWAIPPQ